MSEARPPEVACSSHQNTQLNDLIDQIYMDKELFIRIVSQLLDDARRDKTTRTPSPGSDQTPPHLSGEGLESLSPTLASPHRAVETSRGPTTPKTGSGKITLSDLLTSADSKRKRLITHYEGIPLTLICPEADQLRPPVRRMITPKRIGRLTRAMGQVSIESSDSDPQEATTDAEESSDDEDDLEIVI